MSVEYIKRDAWIDSRERTHTANTHGGEYYDVNFSLSNWFTRQYSFHFTLARDRVTELRSRSQCVPYGIIIAWHGAIFNFALRRKQNTINNHPTRIKKRTCTHSISWCRFANQQMWCNIHQNYGHVAKEQQCFSFCVCVFVCVCQRSAIRQTSRDTPRENKIPKARDIKRCGKITLMQRDNKHSYKSLH